MLKLICFVDAFVLEIFWNCRHFNVVSNHAKGKYSSIAYILNLQATASATDTWSVADLINCPLKITAVLISRTRIFLFVKRGSSAWCHRFTVCQEAYVLTCCIFPLNTLKWNSFIKTSYLLLLMETVRNPHSVVLTDCFVLKQRLLSNGIYIFRWQFEESIQKILSLNSWWRGRDGCVTALERKYNIKRTDLAL